MFDGQISLMETKNKETNLSEFVIPSIEDINSDKQYLAHIISDNLSEIIYQDMNNENSLFLKIKDGFVQKLAQKIVNNPTSALILGVTGESASGKTTLAQKTLDACLSDCNKCLYTIVTGDDYFFDTSKELKEAGSYEALFATGFSFDSPDAVNLELMKEHIKCLAEGNCIYSPKYDFVTCASEAEGTLKSPARVILAEGLFTLNEKLRDILDIAIYVHTPEHVLKDRWYKRAASRGKTGKAADLMFENVNTQAQKHIRPTMNSLGLQ